MSESLKNLYLYSNDELRNLDFDTWSNFVGCTSKQHLQDYIYNVIKYNKLFDVLADVKVILERRDI